MHIYVYMRGLGRWVARGGGGLLGQGSQQLGGITSHGDATTDPRLAISSRRGGQGSGEAQGQCFFS